jgi:hypothetical protein
MGAQRHRDALAPLGALDLHLFVVEDAVVFEEDAGLLGDGLDRAHLGGKGGAPAGVDVARAHGVRPGLEDRVVDVIGSHVDEALALHKRGIGAHEDEVCQRGFVVGDPVAEEPEAVRAFRVPGTDVPVTEVAPALGGEQAVAEGDLGLALLSDLLGGFLDRVAVRHGISSTGREIRA